MEGQGCEITWWGASRIAFVLWCSEEGHHSGGLGWPTWEVEWHLNGSQKCSWRSQAKDWEGPQTLHGLPLDTGSLQLQDLGLEHSKICWYVRNPCSNLGVHTACGCKALPYSPGAPPELPPIWGVPQALSQIASLQTAFDPCWPAIILIVLSSFLSHLILLDSSGSPRHSPATNLTSPSII